VPLGIMGDRLRVPINSSATYCRDVGGVSGGLLIGPQDAETRASRAIAGMTVSECRRWFPGLT